MAGKTPDHKGAARELLALMNRYPKQDHVRWLAEMLEAAYSAGVEDGQAAEPLRK